MGANATLLAALGAVFLGFGLVGVIVQVFSAGLFWSRDQLFVWGNVILGTLLLLIGVAGNLDGVRERLHSGEARRASKYGTSAVLTALLSIALLGLLAFLAERYHTRWDWTEAGTHSLSSQTEKVLGGLERDVAVTAFYAPVSAVRARDLLDRYRYASERFQVRFADPQAEPGLVRRLGVTPEQLEGGLVHVQLGDESVEVTDLSEQSLTNALVKLTRLKRKKVYFLEGHNERPTDGEAAEAGEGLAFAARALENENYVWEKLFLASRGEVPEDADVVIVAGPTRPLHPLEREALKRWVDGGGSAMVMIDPRANTNLGEDLVAWGVRLGDDVVVDRLQGLFGRPVSPFAAEYAPHPITEGLREATLFHVARSVTADPEAGFTTLVRTSEQSWAERDLERFYGEGQAELGEGDMAGPVAVAVAGSLPGNGAAPEEGGEEAAADPEAGRLVVFGDSDFVTNALIEQFRNRDLFVNSVNWLLGDTDAISIRPDDSRASRLTLTGQQFLQLRMLSLFVLPQVIALAGVLAWWWRRRAPGR